MVCSKTLFSAFFAGILTSALFAQSKSAPLQTPRQALVEMLSGSEEKVRKHLTVEVQKKIAELMKDFPAGTDPVKLFIPAAGAQGAQKFDAFDYGPILFALNDGEHHTRLEAHIDSDELSDDEDSMGVSLHTFRNGVEQEAPLAVSFVLNLKLQESTWRLNAITFSATVPLGDPRILDKAFLNPLSLAALNAGTVRAAASVAQEPQSPKMTPLRAVRMISIAEDVYARRHPDQGYTCGIGNLVNVGRGMEDGEVYHFMDPEFARGVYNGYRFQLSGCEGKPVRSFQVVAEPVNGRGKAYCSDDRHNLRMADDGKAASCLVLGKIARQ
jgi:hypothetical protein